MTMREHAGSLAVLAVAVAAASGCNSAPRAGAASRSDSAGVLLVNLPSPDSTVPVWSVRIDSPLVVLGGPKDSTGQFNGFSTAVVLADGRLAIATDDLFRIHVVDSLGGQLGKFGRKGDGPGEFRSVPTIFLHGDTLLAFEQRGSRLIGSVWNSRSELMGERQTRITNDYDSWHGPIGVAGDGSVIVMTAMTVARVGASEGTHRAKVTISRAGVLDSVALRVLELSGDERYGLPGNSAIHDTYVQFGKTTVATVSGGLIQSGTNDGFQIDSWTADGHLVRRLRIGMQPHPITKEMRGRFAREQLEDSRPEARRITEMVLSDMHYAEFLRPYDALYPTQDGGLWVALSRLSDHDAKHFVIVDAAGRVLGAATLPSGFTPMWIGSDRILLAARGRDDVPYIGLYRLAK